MGRKTVSFFLLTVMLLMMLMPSSKVYADDQSAQEVKQTIKDYFEQRYRMLSALSYEEGLENFIAPEILGSKEAVNEDDVLYTIINFRKAQVNDLKFEKYNWELAFDKIEIIDDKAWVSLSDKYELYFNCAPTVLNKASIDHSMILRKVDGRWLVIKDDYIDPDGIKKLLIKYFIENHVSMEEAKKMVLTESEGQESKKLERLQEQVKSAGGDKWVVLSIGKPIAFANGRAQKIDTNSSVVPTIINGRTLLPVRFIAENLNAIVTWEEATATVNLKSGDKTIVIKIGEPVMEVNNKPVSLDVPAQIIGERTMLPVAAVGEALGKEIFWDDRGLIILSNDKLDRNKYAGSVNKLAEYYSVLYTKADFPRIDGSTATYPLTMEIGKELLGLDEMGAKGFLTHNTTHNAYVNLIDKKADIIFVTEPSPEELELAAKNGVELEVVTICKEGFVFLVNSENTVNSVTSKQIRDIYQGKILNWKEVGGEDRQIIPYQRETNSGSQTIMENTVMQGLKMATPPKEMIVLGMGQLIDSVADYSNAKNALGYSVYYYATQMYSKRNVKLLAIDGVNPNKQTIQKGEYPFIDGYYAVLRKDEPENSSARKLLAWLLGEQGQKVVDKAGFVPIK